MDVKVELESFRESFALARILGREDHEKDKYMRCYGHRPKMAQLIRQAFDEVCGKG